ncbi:MAG: hypothetical protein ACLFVI_00820 [Archaeoglobaceae archaeon]
MNRIRILITLLLILIHLNSVAAVTDLNISPEDPVKGDTVTLSGTAQPDKEVKIETSFEKRVNVNDGKYEFSLDDVKIPKGENKFTVIAHGCEDLKVSVKMILIWITLSSQAEDGVAKVSRSAPSGTYDIRIHGKSNEDSVDLEIIATGYVKSNENGEFSYSYDTSSIPPGEFKVTAGGISQTVTLLSEEPTPTPTPSSSGGSSGGGGGGGGGGIISTPAETPTPTTTSTPTPAPTTPENDSGIPTSTPSSTPYTQTPDQTSSDTNVPHSSPTGSPETNPTSPNETPGFSITVAIAVLASLTILRRRGKL